MVTFSLNRKPLGGSGSWASTDVLDLRSNCRPLSRGCNLPLDNQRDSVPYMMRAEHWKRIGAECSSATSKPRPPPYLRILLLTPYTTNNSVYYIDSSVIFTCTQNHWSGVCMQSCRHTKAELKICGEPVDESRIGMSSSPHVMELITRGK